MSTDPHLLRPFSRGSELFPLREVPFGMEYQFYHIMYVYYVLTNFNTHKDVDFFPQRIRQYDYLTEPYMRVCDK